MARIPEPDVLYLDPDTTGFFDGEENEDSDKLEIGAFITKGGELKFFFRSDYKDENRNPAEIIHPDIAKVNLDDNERKNDELLVKPTGPTGTKKFKKAQPDNCLNAKERLQYITKDRVHIMTHSITLATLQRIKGDPKSNCGAGYGGGRCVATA